MAAATVPLTVLSYIALSEGLPNGIAFGGAIIYFVVSSFYIFIAGLLIGLPIVWVLRRLSFISFPILAAAGFLSGGAVSWLILSNWENLDAFPPLIGAIAGLAAAITWWLIAERRTELDA